MANTGMGQIAAQQQKYSGSAVLGGGNAALQTTRDAPAWDQMRSRIGMQVERLSSSISSLAQTLAPALEQTGKNTPQVGRDQAPDQPAHDSSVIEFMRQIERQLSSLGDQVDYLTRALPFDSTPF